MASDVMSGISPARLIDAPIPERDEVDAYEKILKFREDVEAGLHPQLSKGTKPAAHNGVAGSSRQRAPPASSSNSRSLSHASSSERQHMGKLAAVGRPEMNVKRQKIEKELKQQLEKRKSDAQKSHMVGLNHDKDGNVLCCDTDVDLAEAILKSGVPMKPVNRPEDAPGSAKLGEFYGEKREAPSASKPAAKNKKDMEVRDSSSAYSQQDKTPKRSTQAERNQDRRQSQLAANASSGKSAASKPDGTPRTDSTSKPAPSPTTTDRSAPLRDSRNMPAPAHPEARGANREPIPPTKEKTRSPRSPQPRYSATSQVRSPAAPQPIRPANMARVESQNQILIEDDNSAREPSPRPAGYNRSRRASPAPYIKPEPESPYERSMRLPPAHGLRSPDRASFAPEDPYGRPPMYDYPPPPPPAGYFPYPPMMRHPYDAYMYPPRDERFAYPPPPLDYRYPSYPPVSPYFPSHRGSYDDYVGRYHRMASSRPPSRGSRRSLSPRGPEYRRRPSRSRSPVERGRSRRVSPARSPRFGAPSRAPSRAPPPPAGERVPSPPRTVRAEDEPPRPPPERRDSAMPPPFPPRHHYYDERSYFAPPPPPDRYHEEERAYRERDYAREREYDYPPRMAPRYPPPAMYPAGYPPPPPMREHPRAPSRALLPLVESAAEYDARTRGASVRPDVRREGTRPPEYERDVRHESARPPPLDERERDRYYGEMRAPPPPPRRFDGYRY